MHTFPWEPPEEPRHRPSPDNSAPRENPDDPLDDTGEPGVELTRVPAPLRNWQVVEIEGEATVSREEPAGAGEPAARTPIREQPIREQIDPVVVAVLAQRRLAIAPGETGLLAVEVVNNGGKAALFDVTVEGWIDERWCGELPLRVPLQPGARQTVEIPITIPRQTKCRAGEYPLAVVARAARYPGHMTRLAATLVVNAYVAFHLSALEPRRLSTSWFRPAAVVLTRLTNTSNRAVTFRLHAHDRRHSCDYLFLLDEIGALSGRAEVTVGPGEGVEIPLEVRPLHIPLLRVTPQVVPFRLTVRPVDDPALQRRVDGEMTCLPLVGPWHLVGLAVMAVVALVGSGLAGLALLMALRTGSAPSAQAPVAVPTAAAPVIAFVLKMGDPVPAAAGAASGSQSAPVVRPSDVTAPGSAGASAATPSAAIMGGGQPPVVRADQVTAPGEPLPPAAQTPMQPFAAPPAQAPSTAPVGQTPRGNLTYAQMFQEIALRFDLDWRMLAATAYVESGFDSLALGQHGDLGLMQIQPATWQEWAPSVDAADPFDSYSNTLVGAAYLDYVRALLAARGHSGMEWMLVAYNWGPDKLLDFLASGGTWESLAPELRQYAQDVLQIASTIPAN